MQEVSGALCMRGSRKDHALVFPQHLQPALNIGCMFCSCLRGQFQISAKKRCPQLGNKFLPRITFITPFLTPEVAIKAVLVLRPVSQLMGKRGIVCFRTTKRFEMWHLHVITAPA